MKKIGVSCFVMLFLIIGFCLFNCEQEIIVVDATIKEAYCLINGNNTSYRVVYETNGGNKLQDGYTEINGVYASNTSDSFIQIPTKEGYQFAGWYYDKELTKRVTATTVKGVVEQQTGNVVDCGSNDLSVVVYAKWVKENIICPSPVIGGSFNISYETNGGNKISAVKVSVGAEPTQFGKLPTPTKEGYLFAGWYYDQALTSPVNAEYNASVKHIVWVTENGCEYTKNIDVTLYAKWIVNDLENIDVCPEPVDGGSFNISYETNGGNKISDVKVSVGAEPTQFGKLPTPTKEGYLFAGWYYDQALTSPVNAKYNASVKHIVWVTENGCEYTKNIDVTLYAKWIVNDIENIDICPDIEQGGSFKVNYVPNNGSSIEPSTVCRGCAPTNEKLPIPTKEGYLFAGWYYDEEYTKIVSGDKLTNVDYKVTKEIDGCIFIVDSDVTLYAKWIVNDIKNIDVCPDIAQGGSFKVNYVPNNGSSIEPSTVCRGCAPTNEKLPIPTKEGYLFAGWYYDEEYTKIVSGDKLTNVDYMVTNEVDGCIFIVDSDVTLYAKWVVDDIKNIDVCPDITLGGKFEIYYETNGGSTIEKMNVCAGCDSTLTKLPVPTRDGYEFGGWYYDENLTDAVNVTYAVDVNHTDVVIENGCVIYKNKNRTLYAKWEKVYKNSDVELIMDDRFSSNIISINVKSVEKEDNSLKILDSKLSKFNAYDINLLDENGMYVQPNGYVKLKFLLPENVNQNNVIVYRVEEDKLVEYDATIVDGYVEIETNHFSIYVVGEKKSVSNPETGDSLLFYLGLSLLLIITSLVVTKKLKYNK